MLEQFRILGVCALDSWFAGNLLIVSLVLPWQGSLVFGVDGLLLVDWPKVVGRAEGVILEFLLRGKHVQNYVDILKLLKVQKRSWI